MITTPESTELSPVIKSTMLILATRSGVQSHASFANGIAVSPTFTGSPPECTTFAGLYLFLSCDKLTLKDRASSQPHSCSALCSAPGMCEISIVPQSVEVTFTGRYDTFQYTKVITSSLYAANCSDFVLFSIPKVCSESTVLDHSDTRTSCEAAAVCQDY